MKLAAGRVGQLINASAIGSEAGATTPTIQQWIAALRSTYICFSLRPHFKNFNKKIVKSPKLYFYDTGLLCYLLGINAKEQLDIHPLRGNIFENFIVSEVYKNKLNTAQEQKLYFWRDQKGHEIDLIEDRSTYPFPKEIKLGQTFNSSYIKNLTYFNKLQRAENVSLPLPSGAVIYCGDDESTFKDINIQNWQNLL